MSAGIEVRSTDPGPVGCNQAYAMVPCNLIAQMRFQPRPWPAVKVEVKRATLVTIISVSKAALALQTDSHIFFF
jgi:hypothetical protein